MASIARKDDVAPKDEWPMETFAKILVDTDEPMMDPEEIQEKAISQMTARIIKEDEVVGPTTAISRSTQAPSRAPSPLPSGSSSTSRTEAKRQRAGPAQQKAPVIPTDTPRATMQQFCLDFGLVVLSPHFDLEKAEHAFAADPTVATAAKMAITTTQDLDQMKDIMQGVLDPKLEVLIEGNTFVAEPPKRRHRTRGHARKAKHPLRHSEWHSESRLS